MSSRRSGLQTKSTAWIIANPFENGRKRIQIGDEVAIYERWAWQELGWTPSKHDPINPKKLFKVEEVDEKRECLLSNGAIVPSVWLARKMRDGSFV